MAGETSWWDGFLDTVKELGGGFLNYDLKKTEIENGSNSSSSTTGGYETYPSNGSSSNNTMLIVGALAVIALVLVVARK